MQLLNSDTTLIDMKNGELLETLFRLPMRPKQ